MESDVQTVVLGVTIVHPETEVARRHAGEAALACGGIDWIRAEAIRNVVIAGTHEFEVETERSAHLHRIPERSLVRIRSFGKLRRRKLARRNRPCQLTRDLIRRQRVARLEQG